MLGQDERRYFTIAELKQKLKGLGQPVSGNRAELLKRLAEVDPEDRWRDDDDVHDGAGGDMSQIDENGTDVEDREDDSAPLRSRARNVDCAAEVALLRRERDLLAREIDLMRRENALLCENYPHRTDRREP